MTKIKLIKDKTPKSNLDIDKTEISKAMRSIVCGFVWSDTDQGGEYWAEVHSNLEKLRNG